MYTCISVSAGYKCKLFTNNNRKQRKIKKIGNFDTDDLSDFLAENQKYPPLPFLQGKFRLIQISEQLRKLKNQKKKYDKKTPY